MPRFGNIIIAYFVIGAVMFGGGAISYDDAGVTGFFVSFDDSGSGDADVSPTNETGGALDDVGGAISQVVELFSGGLILVWNLVVGLIAFVNWPLTVTIENDLPPRLIVLLGGTPTAMFYVSAIRLIRTSA